MNRQTFLKTGLYGLGSFFVPSILASGKKKRQILVLGGTDFVGPAIVKACLAKNYTVALLNRGITNPTLFPQLELIKCDRNVGVGSIAKLQSRRWDAVIDVWPQDPRLVEESASFFKTRTSHYIYVSSIAAYRDYKQMDLDETYPTRVGSEFIEGQYGTNKAISERVVKKYFPNNFTIVRPCPITGERDTSYFFRYWTWNIKRGKEILAPDGTKETTQFVDVDDVGQWVSETIEHDFYGFYNTVGPESYLSFHGFLEQCKRLINQAAKIVYVSNDFLKANQIDNLQATPQWKSLSADDRAFFHISNHKAKSLGMKFKPVSNCILDSLKTYNDEYQFGDRENWAGLSEKEERDLIAKWKAGSR